MKERPAHATGSVSLDQLGMMPGASPTAACRIRCYRGRARRLGGGGSPLRRGRGVHSSGRVKCDVRRCRQGPWDAREHCGTPPAPRMAVLAGVAPSVLPPSEGNSKRSFNMPCLPQAQTSAEVEETFKRINSHKGVLGAIV
eukprot:CAMPEP_0182908000 /NCGR_PEP_ID=MMETSP0034_2-20130328/34916_1 /TAXON_ID=156128 /ORGANISM="Nephroselmis pyriformis, Strain CCMP717" /LENGTH=140 /DNA_ID=CAMNT_0025044093 /DNA_START=86 /DNA_END=504 /DNA_ORIENTATION=+